MIKMVIGKAKMEFGTGDICVAGGRLLGEENIGVVNFVNQEPHKIGEVGTIKAYEPWDTNESDVVMTFTSIKSIDVVIEHLQQSKQCMQCYRDIFCEHKSKCPVYREVLKSE